MKVQKLMIISMNSIKIICDLPRIDVNLDEEAKGIYLVVFSLFIL